MSIREGQRYKKNKERYLERDYKRGEREREREKEEREMSMYHGWMCSPNNTNSSQRQAMKAQRYVNKNRVCYKYLDNEVSCQQLFCCICSAI